MENVVNETKYKDVLIDRLNKEKKDYFLSVISSIKESEDSLSVLDKETYKLSCYEELLFQITFQIDEGRYEKEIKHFKDEISLFSMYQYYTKLENINIGNCEGFLDFLSLYLERLEMLEDCDKSLEKK